MSRVVGQNSLTPHDDRNLLTSSGNGDGNFRLARDGAVHLETAAIFSPSRRQANNVSAVFCSFELRSRTLHELSYGKQCEGLEETKRAFFSDASHEVFVSRLAVAERESDIGV